MASKIILTSDGLKIKDTKTGELLGSIGNGKSNNVPTVATLKVSETVLSVTPMSPIDIAGEQYALHLKNIAEFKTTAQKSAEPQIYEELAHELARALPTDIDEAQLLEVYRLLYNGVNRIKSEELVDPTDEQWAQWLVNTETRIKSIDADFDDVTMARLLAQLDKVKRGKKPDATAFLILSRLDGKVWAAKYSLDEGYRQISAWFDVSPVVVKWQVAEFRKKYLEAEALGIAPEIDPGYSNGYKTTAGSGPKDNATVYGHLMAENPELYDENAVPTRFVAFDTETTGLESRNANVIQIGMVEYDHNGNETRRFVTYIKPPADENGVISTGDEGARASHGITPADVASAPSFAEVMPKIQEFFEGATVIGQNVIQFDARHLAAEYIRASDGDKSAGKNLWFRAADTLWYAKRHLGHLGLTNNKLITLNTHFQLPPFNAHDAGADAHATGLLFFHIRRQLKERQLAATAKRRAEDVWAV